MRLAYNSEASIGDFITIADESNNKFLIAILISDSQEGESDYISLRDGIKDRLLKNARSEWLKTSSRFSNAIVRSEVVRKNTRYIGYSYMPFLVSAIAQSPEGSVLKAIPGVSGFANITIKKINRAPDKENYDRYKEMLESNRNMRFDRSIKMAITHNAYIVNNRNLLLLGIRL